MQFEKIYDIILSVAEKSNDEYTEKYSSGKLGVGTATGSKRLADCTVFTKELFKKKQFHIFTEKYSSGRRGVTRNLVGR